MKVWNSLSRQRKFAVVALGLLLVYTVVGFLILPPIVRRVAITQISRQLDRKVSIEKVELNPFALSTTVRGFLIQDPDGEPFISWDEVYVNFQLASFFGRAWVFQEIRISKPFVRARMKQDGTFNFSDLIAKFSTNAAPAKTGPPGRPLVLHIGRLRIAGATAAVADFTPRVPFKRTVGPLDITLDDFETEPDSRNPYAFTGTTDAGEQIAWSGYFSLAPLRSEGQLSLYHFTLNKYAPLYQDLVRFEIRDGSLELKTKYRFELDATNRVAAVSDTSVALRNLKLGRPGETSNLADLPLLAITGASVDLQRRQATVDSVAAIGAKLFLLRDPSNVINVVELSQPAPNAGNAPGGILFLLRAVTNTVALLLNSTNEWSGTVRQVSVTNCAVQLADEANARPAKLALSEISLDAKNLSNLPGTNLEAHLALRWNTNGAIHLAATAGFQPMAADVQMDLDHLDLTSLDAYLAPRLDLYLLGSQVNLHGLVRLRPLINGLPVVSFHGDASLEDFHTVDGAFGEDLLKWDALRFQHVVANLNPPLVVIREIDLDRAYARLVIETNKTVNLLNALRLTHAPATNETKTATTATAEAAGNPAPDQPLQISIGAIVITNTAISFSDRSMVPEVDMAIQSVNGTVTGLSTEQRQHAIVDLRARIDGVGPATISGTINPLNGAETNHLDISVKDVDLTPASPYAGKFAGYRIAEGKLNLDLTYDLIGKRLQAKNVITLDRFTFGEKVESPDATHLPVRLGIAILKDRDGRIILDVPVAGDLDDPKFRVGKVVMRAIVNILEKVATSPFSLLGAAFGGGGEELGYQEFTPGSPALSVEDAHKLDSLAQGLYARPALKLELDGSVEPAADREGLQRAAIDQQIRTRIWQRLRKAERATNTVDQIALAAADRARWVAKLYTEAVTDGRINAQLIAADPNLAAYAGQALPRKPEQKGAAQLMNRPATPAPARTDAGYQTKLVPPPDPMEALLLATIPVTESDLETLAARRAQAVQTYLLKTGRVDASRLFLKTGRRNEGSRVYLQFQ